MKRKRILLAIVVMMMVTLLSACDKKLMFVGSNYKNKIEASYRLFSGTEEKKISLKNGETLVIDYQSEVKKGDLTIKLYDPDDELLQELGTNKSGKENIEVSKDGRYRLEITGDNANGSFEITYKIK